LHCGGCGHRWSQDQDDHHGDHDERLGESVVQLDRRDADRHHEHEIEEELE